MNLFILSAIFSVICLDRKHAFQVAISQPLVTCTILGFLLDAPTEAMYFGMIVQLVWLSNLPIGAAKTPEGDIGSVVGCILYVKFYDKFLIYGQFLLFVTFLITVFSSFLANLIESLTRKVNIWFYNYVYKTIKFKDKERVGLAITGAISIQLILNFVFIIFSVLSGKIVLENLMKIVEKVSPDTWQFVNVAILGSGIGMLSNVFKDKKSKRIIASLSIVFLFILISI